MPDDITPEQKSLLAALKRHGPCSRYELAQHANQTCNQLGGRLKGLQLRGLVVIDDAGRIALPGQKIAAAWRPDDERTHAARQALWQRQGLLLLHPDDVGGLAAQALFAFAVSRYGRRLAR